MRYDFCKGDIVASFDSMKDAMAWAEKHGYIWLEGFSTSTDIAGENTEYFADPMDLPEGITVDGIDGHENEILDYYGLGYEPCIIPREV